MILALLFIPIIAIYAILINYFIGGWKELPLFETDKLPAQIPVTIITPFKNEENNLPHLAKSLDNQSYQNFEWILVDDNSNDNSYATVENIISEGFFGINLLKNNGKGKKEAIRTAIYQAKNELIVQLDADTIVDKDWLLNIVAFLQIYPSDLLICPVKMAENKSFWGQFQKFEFAVLNASGAGAAAKGMPIYCNGANMAFLKSVWLKHENELNFKEKSGDDVFLLHAIKKDDGIIRFIKSPKVAVKTQTVNSFQDLLKQRGRWAGKKGMYKDMDIAVTGFVVFSTIITLIATALLSFIGNYLWIFLLIFGVKYFVDTTFFLKIRKFYGLKHVIIRSFIFSLVYPFYIILSVFSIFFKKKWKD